MKFIELFAGVGGLGWGLTQAGMECVGYAECDTACSKCKTYTRHLQHLSKKFYTICESCGTAKWQQTHQSYQILHDPEERMWHRYDVTTVTDDDIRCLGRERGHISLIAAGFPCQAFSVAGKREGFADQTRGTLFFEVIRFASILRPEHLLLENVDGLRSHDEGRTLGIILSTLDEVGYNVEWQVLNSSAYIPQNRERIYIVASLRGKCTGKIFPFEGENSSVIEVVGRLEGNHDQNSRVYGIGGVAPTFSTMQGGGQEPKVLVNNKPTQFSFDGEGIAYCLDTGYAKNLSPNEVGKGKRQIVVTVGNVNPSGNGMNGNVFDSKGLSPTLTTNKGEGIKVFLNQERFNQYKTSDVCQTVRVGGDSLLTMEPRAVLTPDRAEKRQNGRRMKEPGEPMFTLTAQDLHGVLIEWAIRKLTPLECFRLQTYPDLWYVTLKLYRHPELIDHIDMSRNDITAQVQHLIADKGIKEGMSDSQLYKMAGNGVTSAVAFDIGQRIMQLITIGS